MRKRYASNFESSSYPANIFFFAEKHCKQKRVVDSISQRPCLQGSSGPRPHEFRVSPAQALCLRPPKVFSKETKASSYALFKHKAQCNPRSNCLIPMDDKKKQRVPPNESYKQNIN